jgi:hypothetical protein
MVGSIGVWGAGELASAQTGRLLVPVQSAQLADNPAIASLGPATAAVDDARNVVVLDFIGTFPELNVQLDKANFGTFELQSVDAKGVAIKVWRQSDNVPFEQSRNVPLTASAWKSARRTTTDDASR